MTTLAIDTSNSGMSLALYKKETLIGEMYIGNQKNHSVTLMPGIDFLMQSNNLSPQDLERIVVSEGPGSYTGLRIGVTTAKTLAWTLGIELMSVSSLAVIAATQHNQEGLIVPIINARRQNVYTGAYEWIDGSLQQVIPDCHIALSEWLVQLKETSKPCFFVGEDLFMFPEIIENDELLHDETCCNNQLSGRSFILLEQELEKVEDIDAFVPKYLKKVEAEEKWMLENGSKEQVYVERV